MRLAICGRCGHKKHVTQYVMGCLAERLIICSKCKEEVSELPFWEWMNREFWPFAVKAYDIAALPDAAAREMMGAVK